VPVDLDDGASLRAVARLVEERHGRLDALVSNAGFVLAGVLEECAEDELRAQLETNVVGTLSLCRLLLGPLRAAQGVIVQVSSISGREGGTALGAYVASKWALEGASQTLAEEIEPFGVRVVIVEPSAFRGTAVARKTRWARSTGGTGLYGDVLEARRRFFETLADEGEDEALAIAAIVRAATVPGAPLRLPVGRRAFAALRAQAAAATAELDRAEAFLRG
jgi:NAD(P)-dependent dehydrogenase (short-subunit alcohol dehydrogenase family)